MEFLKSLFESGALTWEQFTQAVAEKGYKLADLATGNYVSKRKYDDDLGSRDNTIKELNEQITTRDTDIAGLKEQLTAGGKDNKAKIEELTNKITQMQGDYATVKDEYEARLNKQAYEFAVREYAGEKKFSSAAARRDFINAMISEDLKVKDNTIIGADDFLKVYQEQNADAFVVEEPATPPPADPLPTFGQPTPPATPPEENAFIQAFGFQK